MDNFTFYAPTRIVFGKDTQSQVGALAAGYGFKKALIHYGSGSVVKSGLLAQVRASLTESGVGFVELGGVQPNPVLSLVREGVALCKKQGVDFVLAVGGGSVIDSAKLIAVGAKTDEDPWLFSTKVKAPTAALPVGTILTLAASGSEMSGSCVITNEDGMLKRGYMSEMNRAVFSILNPELTYTLPPFQTACGIADIFMHTFERYISPGEETDLTDRLAEGLMKATLDAGLVAYGNPADYDARATLMWAGSVSHNDLTGLGRRVFMPVHQMEHELSGMFPFVSHAAGLTALLPAWMRFAYQADIPRFAQFAVRVMGCDMNFEHPEHTALEGILRIEAYFRSIGLPVTLRELGMPDDRALEEMAEKCTFNGTRTLAGKVVMGKAEILTVFREAMG